jgi:hypothetical protein
MEQLRAPFKGLYAPYLETGVPVGRYRLSGTVARLGVPGRYRIILYSRATKLPVRSFVSNDDGPYLIEHLANTEYFLVAHDHTGAPVNAAISDYVTPEPMNV